MKKIFILVVIVIASSCGDKFLDKKPQGQYNPDILKTSAGIEGALTGAYALLDGIGTSGVTSWHGAVSNWILAALSPMMPTRARMQATSRNKLLWNATSG